MAASTPTPSPASKVCMVCKQDCSGRPRSKDEQGRYTCADCAKKMAAGPVPVVKAAAGAPAVAAKPAAKGPDDGLGKLGAESLPSYLFDEKPVELTPDQEMCQNCGNVMKKSHVVCIKCGHNKQSGKTLRTALKRPEVIDGEKKKRKAYFTLDNIFVVGGIWLACAASIAFALIAGGSGDEATMGLSLMVMLAVGGILGLASLIATFFESVTMGLLLLLFAGLNIFSPFGKMYVSLGGTAYTIYWMLCECESAFVRHTYFASLLQWIMFVVMILHFGAKLGE